MLQNHSSITLFIICVCLSDEHIYYSLSSYNISKLRYGTLTLNIKCKLHVTNKHSSVTILIICVYASYRRKPTKLCVLSTFKPEIFHLHPLNYPRVTVFSDCAYTCQKTKMPKINILTCSKAEI